MLAQLDFQMRPDGSHFEQSTYYHVYAVDFFVFFYLLSGRPAEMEAHLVRMADYLHALLGSNRKLAFQGDDDGGRLFHPVRSARSVWTGNARDMRQSCWGAKNGSARSTNWRSKLPGGSGRKFWTGPSNDRRGSEASRFFPDSGSLFLRNELSCTSDGLWAVRIWRGGA